MGKNHEFGEGKLRDEVGFVQRYVVDSLVCLGDGKDI